MFITKRDGTKQKYNPEKINKAIKAAMLSANCGVFTKYNPAAEIEVNDGDSVETIQNKVENWLMDNCKDAARNYILYRESHKMARLADERIKYMNNYSNSSTNAASASETDANANVTMKNAANLEGEVYKTTNRIIQRRRMKSKLNEMFPEVSSQYVKDLEHHIIYTNDEASTPVLKQYCMAVSLYPLLTQGVGNIDGVTPSAPNDLQSFSGQITNLIFLLSSQCKGAVAVGEYFIALNYYVIAEFGTN